MTIRSSWLLIANKLGVDDMKKHKQVRHMRRKPTRADISHKNKAKHYLRAVERLKKIIAQQEQERLEQEQERSTMKS